MFASRVTREVALPGDDGESVSVTIRKLSWGQLEHASEAMAANAGRKLAALGPEAISALQGISSGAESKPSPDARFAGYDQREVLRAGVVSWSVDVELPAGLDDLTSEAARTLSRAILTLSVPPVEEAVEGKD